jgi:hypothetical protein
MHKVSSIVAFLFFAIAWGMNIATTNDPLPLMNVGFMWLSIAAIGGNTN